MMWFLFWLPATLYLCEKKETLLMCHNIIGHVHFVNSVQMGLKNHILYVLRGEGNCY